MIETAIPIAIYFIARLSWIKRFQSIVLLRSPAIYVRLPSLSFMLFKRFWVWNEIKFLPDNISATDIRVE